MKETLTMIAAEKLHPNPDNPRKSLGDLTELAESIRKNGVMQNLTVMPQEGKPGEYTIIMGHRRHAAVVQAGLKELPCRVMEKLERPDQVAAMLAENLHRSNLTPYEEGQGFQLMLDLGETEKSIAEKTGFGKTTVRHRVNIAKFDQEKLKKRQEDEAFQFSITDLIALEKVPDIDKRNEILEEARDGRDLAFKAQCAAQEIKRGENLAKAIPMLEKADVKPAPEKVPTEIYDSGKWQTVETLDLEGDLPDSYRPKQAGELFYYKTYREVKIIKRAEKKPKPAKLKSEAERKRHEEESRKKKNRKQLLELAKEADAVRRDFIRSVIDGKVAALKGDDLAKAQAALWRILYETCATMSRNGCITFYGGKEDDYSMSAEERVEAGKWADRLEMTHQMMITAHGACGCRDLISGNGEYSARIAEKVKKLYAALRLFGLRVEKETKQLLDGKHEFYYIKPAPEKPAMLEDKTAKAGTARKPKAEPAVKAKADPKTEEKPAAKAKPGPVTKAEPAAKAGAARKKRKNRPQRKSLSRR